MRFASKYQHQKIKDDMIILGRVQSREVSINGLVLDKADSLAIFNHSPDGFAWGYAGSGPSQLALAMLLAVGVRPKLAVQLHQRFKMDVLTKIPMEDDFRMTVKSVRNWCNAYEKQLKKMGEMLKNE